MSAFVFLAQNLTDLDHSRMSIAINMQQQKCAIRSRLLFFSLFPFYPFFLVVVDPFHWICTISGCSGTKNPNGTKAHTNTIKKSSAVTGHLKALADADGIDCVGAHATGI